MKGHLYKISLTLPTVTIFAIRGDVLLKKISFADQYIIQWILFFIMIFEFILFVRAIYINFIFGKIVGIRENFGSFIYYLFVYSLVPFSIFFTIFSIVKFSVTLSSFYFAAVFICSLWLGGSFAALRHFYIKYKLIED